MGAQATLAVLLLFCSLVVNSSTAVQKKGNVKFEHKQFIMTCPEPGDWFKKQAKLKPSAETNNYTQTYNGKTKGLYHCKYKSTGGVENKYYFYVKGKGCANCLDVKPEHFAAAIVVDVVVTACVMLMVFRCTKKKSSASSKAAARPGGRPPPGQSEYEVLNRHTRSEEYSTVSRTG
ncbi:T-cell surface glycoprotein CD3 epsilon chain-like [Pungitius pungitius]|uniref:T-cell surface glycoprotein CD3 epsilon chain-like n=1 Tax=Pungitius pungitius TaxID=134920 RepID=UPI002E0F1BAC